MTAVSIIATALDGQTWTQVSELAGAFGLAALIGLERETRQKSAGLRTHSLVGLGAALFMLVSKYGFSDVFVRGEVMLDPSRVAAQIVSGIGFIGGGLIFVRRDAVRGLTTAASVWLTAAVGAAAGAGLLVLAALCTAGHFVIVYGLPPIVRRLPATRPDAARLRLTYEVGTGVLQTTLAACTRRGFSVTGVEIGRTTTGEVAASIDGRPPADVRVDLTGRASTADLVAEIAAIPGMRSVTAGDEDEAAG